MDEMITILGPTATGKTDLAAYAAYRLEGEVISADSRQVYRGMDIGTGKDLESFRIGGTEIPYHLVDICNPGDEYNVFQYREDFRSVYHQLKERGRLPVLCGGTGLYLNAVLNDYRLEYVPENPDLRCELKYKSIEELIRLLESYGSLHNTTDIADPERLLRAIEIKEHQRNNDIRQDIFPVPSRVFGISFNRETLRRRIEERLTKRLENGMVEEVKGLIDRGVTEEKMIYYGLEYRYVTLYLIGRLGYDEMKIKLYYAICQFSKRQATWFRKMEKEGINITWIDGKLSTEQKFEVIRSATK